jgi:co-chaperonin GroES (HSP10)
MATRTAMGKGRKAGPSGRLDLTGIKAKPSKPTHFTGTSSHQRMRGMAHFRPPHDRILVKRIEAEEKTPGGIIIPDTAKEKPIEGEVLAAGPGARDESGTVQPLDVKVGDRVLFGNGPAPR